MEFWVLRTKEPRTGRLGLALDIDATGVTGGKDGSAAVRLSEFSITLFRLVRQIGEGSSRIDAVLWNCEQPIGADLPKFEARTARTDVLNLPSVDELAKRGLVLNLDTDAAFIFYSFTLECEGLKFDYTGALTNVSFAEMEVMKEDP